MTNAMCAKCRDRPAQVFKTHGGPLCLTCDSAGQGKRSERFCRRGGFTRHDILEKRYAEMRSAIDDRDRYRRDALEIKDSLRAEVRREEIERVRHLSFWRRLRLLFDPWGCEQSGGGVRRQAHEPRAG